MEEKKKKFLVWIKSHKRQLILAGVSITIVVGIILKINKEEEFAELWLALKECTKKISCKDADIKHISQISVPMVEETSTSRIYTFQEQTINVRQHIRNLTGNRKHSVEKKCRGCKTRN